MENIFEISKKKIDVNSSLRPIGSFVDISNKRVKSRNSTKYRFYLKFKTYNPEDFERVAFVLKSVFDQKEVAETVDASRMGFLEKASLTRTLPQVPTVSLIEGSIKISKGPVPLPRKKKLFTVNRSPYVDKKSQEQFIQTTYNRVWIIDLVKGETSKLTENLKGTVLQEKLIESFTEGTYGKKNTKTLNIPTKGTDRVFEFTNFVEEKELLLCVNTIKKALEPLESLPGLSLQWKCFVAL